MPHDRAARRRSFEAKKPFQSQVRYGAMPGHRENCGKDSQGSVARAYPFHPHLFVQN
ncbi:hypothetical protein DESPIG_01073 [Desulfovibrio piger ATCC 29098]|uniref:Uncharacterized protein n=1 Tax=Desulfovibrio piger ATCC 29098 TaxID=411464 RepID=B6WSF1_9BACT|nr:hypothetical protein DESPIG_01073 [Desulfovibrio piger ATCC 29098]